MVAMARPSSRDESGHRKRHFAAPAPAVNVQTANFTITAPAGVALFQINGKSYNPDVVNYTRQVNTTDEWLLTAGPPAAASAAGNEPHIFHIHVNPFEVIDIAISLITKTVA